MEQHGLIPVALFAGLDHDPLPTLDLMFTMAMVFATAAEDRDKGMDPQFRRLLDEQIHLFAFEQGLGHGERRNGMWCAGLPAIGHPGCHSKFADSDKFGDIDQAGAVEKFDMGAWAEPQYLGQVSSLGTINVDALAVKTRRWQEKSSHGPM